MTTARRIVALAVGALVLLPHGAQADDPLFTDSPNDGIGPVVCLSGSVDTCSTTDPLSEQTLPVPVVEPSIDLLEGRLTTHGNELVLTTTVVDVDAPTTVGAAHRLYGTRATVNGLQLDVWHWQPAGGGRPQSSVVVQDLRTFSYGNWDVVATVDVGTNTITWHIPLAALDDARAQACASCPEIGRGTVLTGIQTATSARVETSNAPYSSDHAWADRDYTI